jgi:hypothetical protein
MNRSPMPHQPSPARACRRTLAGVLRVGLLLAAALLLAAVPRGGSVRSAGHPGHEAQGGMAFDQRALLFTTAPAAERWTSPSGGAPPGTAKTQAPDALGLALAAERQVRTAAVRIAGTQRMALVALRRCRSLFPFHFFW